jgi:alkylation response protein AidB-like acyl-CoA dehydrogenase
MNGVAWSRAERLERRLGNPWDPGNLVGFAAVLAADEASRMLEPGERLLDDFQLGAEYVPVALGGRLRTLDETMYVLRTVFARDPCLGLGHGVSSLIAAVNVWTSGDDVQRALAARLLCKNRKLAVAFHELAHGNDLARSELQARPTSGGRLLLSGRKEVIANIQRCDALVLVARTGQERGARSHSQLLIDKHELTPGSFGYLPRFTAAGMRGVPLGGIEFHGSPVDSRCTIGQVGQGLETALRAYQITRVLLPGVFLGSVDTGLRIALRYLFDRHLYGSTAAALPQAQATLVDVFVDLLRADAFTMTAVRALHVVPAEASLFAPAVKQLVPKLLLDTMESLASLLGAGFYLRNGPASMLQKLLRDLQPLAFGHVGRAACQASILPQLAALARRGTVQTGHAARDIFRLDTPLPAIRFDALVVMGAGQESISPVLAEAADSLASCGGQDEQELRELIGNLRRELAALLMTAKALPSCELWITAGASAFELAGRYCALLGATACVGVWSEARATRTPFLSEPAWLIAALRRALPRQTRVLPALSTALRQRLFQELTLRYREERSFDLARRKRFEP